MREESLRLLSNLLTTASPSGFEARGQAIWLREAKALADQCHTDTYGNAFACINPGGSPRIMITGHADEIGFMVSYIDDRGFLYLQAIGGVDSTIMRGKRVNIHAAQGVVRGVLGVTAIHIKDRDRDAKPTQIHEVYVDIAATSRETAGARVAIGDPVTLVDDFEVLHGQIAVARAFDNRVGTFSALESLRLLHDSKAALGAEVWAVSTVQEELGGNGARMAAVSLKPDVCLAIDVTHATDSPGVSKEKHGDIRLGQGPTISFGSSNHPVVVKRLLEVAAQAEIKIQREVAPRRTGTDLDHIFVQGGGIAGAVLGIPNRYMHSAVEMVNLTDLENTALLVAAFCKDVKAGEEFRVRVEM